MDMIQHIFNTMVISQKMCILYFVGENEKREMGEQSRFEIPTHYGLNVSLISHLSPFDIRYSYCHRDIDTR